MIRRRAQIKRSAVTRQLSWMAKTGTQLRSSLTKSCTCAQGHKHDSRMEAGTCDDLHLLERAGRVQNIQRQVTHQLYARADGGWCSCMGELPGGSKWCRIYAPRLDFEFDELVSGGVWAHIYADTKGWVNRHSGQYVAYKLFAALHEQEIRLYKK